MEGLYLLEIYIRSVSSRDILERRVFPFSTKLFLKGPCRTQNSDQYWINRQQVLQDFNLVQLWLRRRKSSFLVKMSRISSTYRSNLMSYGIHARNIWYEGLLFFETIQWYHFQKKICLKYCPRIIQSMLLNIAGLIYCCCKDLRWCMVV